MLKSGLLNKRQVCFPLSQTQQLPMRTISLHFPIFLDNPFRILSRGHDLVSVSGVQLLTTFPTWDSLPHEPPPTERPISLGWASANTFLVTCSEIFQYLIHIVNWLKNCCVSPWFLKIFPLSGLLLPPSHLDSGHTLLDLSRNHFLYRPSWGPGWNESSIHCVLPKCLIYSNYQRILVNVCLFSQMVGWHMSLLLTSTVSLRVSALSSCSMNSYRKVRGSVTVFQNAWQFRQINDDCCFLEL